MPNWCENDLFVKGAKKDLMDFLMTIEGEQSAFDFNKFIPYPEEFAAMDSVREGSGYNSGGYEWCQDNWGTKWNSSKVIIKLHPWSVFITFDTAWAPPIPVIKKAAEMFPKLRFKMYSYEQGIGLQSVLEIKRGEVIYEEREYSGYRGG